MKGMCAAAVLADENGPVPPESNVALLLRHAAREPIPEGSFGQNVPLTQAGVASAEQLGKALSTRLPGLISSSPLPRCVQTAGAIARGAKWRCERKTDSRLGNHGAFVTCANAAGDLFIRMNKNIREIVRCQLYDPKPPAGMCSAAKGGRILLEYIDSELATKAKGRLNIHVTHDSILAAFMGWLFTIPAHESAHWPNFLDGIVLWRSEDQLFALLTPDSVPIVRPPLAPAFEGEWC